MKKPALILFDFDGTLTTKDSMMEFVRFVRGSQRLQLGFLWLAPVLVAYKLGIISNQKAKERFLRFHLGGISRDELRQKGVEFGQSIIPQLLRPAGLSQLKRYQDEGAKVVLVSASLDIWLEAWASSLGIHLICTQASYEEGVFSGQLASPNCYGPEKLTRIKSEIKLENFGRTIAYGDSGGDKELLAWADEAHFKPFRD